MKTKIPTVNFLNQHHLQQRHRIHTSRDQRGHHSPPLTTPSAPSTFRVAHATDLYPGCQEAFCPKNPHFLRFGREFFLLARK